MTNALVAEATALIRVESTPAIIDFNYEETRAWLETELQKYDVVVTLDTLPDCKKLATELNKRAADISSRRLVAVKKVSAPIRVFEEQAKSLEKMCKDGRTKLLDQAQVFEDETRALALVALKEAVAAMWEEQKITVEFRWANVTDMAKLNTLTKSGKLSSSAKSELVIRVNADRNLQQNTELRLQKLENESYRAGLAAPLTRAHVETFLFASDEDYSQRLQAIIASELDREKVAEERIRKRFEDEQRQIAEKAQRQAEAEDRRAQKQAQDQARQQQQSVQQPVQQPTHEVDAAPEPQRRIEPEDAAPVRREPESAVNLERFAFGVLNNPAGATVVTAARFDAERQAVDLSIENAAQPIGMWQPKPVGLVAIVFNAIVYRKEPV